MKKVLVILLFIICMICMASCSSKGLGPDKEANLDDAKEASDYLNYNGVLYTNIYCRDLRLTHLWIPFGEADDYDIAYSVSAEEPDEQVLSSRIQTFTNDPNHNFILECESLLFNEELYRKSTFEIPDYLDEEASISRIRISNGKEDEQPSDFILLDNAKDVQQFMQIVRQAVNMSAKHPEQLETVNKDQVFHNCYVEFDGFNGMLYIGFLAQGSDEKLIFSAYETDYSTGLNGFQGIKLPESLQNLEIKN